MLTLRLIGKGEERRLELGGQRVDCAKLFYPARAPAPSPPSPSARPGQSAGPAGTQTLGTV